MPGYSAGGVLPPPAAAAAAFALAGLLRSADKPGHIPEDPNQYLVEHAECTFFGKDHDKFVNIPKPSSGPLSPSAITQQVAAALPPPAIGTHTASTSSSDASGVIDKYLFQAMLDAGVTPADPST